MVTSRRFFMHPILRNTALGIFALAALLNCSPASGVSNEPLVNGPTTSGKTRPFCVSLARGYMRFCSGVLVSPKVVLTAYHCIKDEQILYNTLFGNYVEIPYTPKGLQRRSVVKIISTSPETDKAVTKGAGELDYALLILDEAVALSTYPARATSMPGGTFEAQILGFRAHGELGADNRMVLSAPLSARVHDSRRIYATQKNGIVGAEHGDSGGALLKYNTWEVLGIVEGGPDYQKGSDAYTRIDQTRCFIANIIAANGGEGPQWPNNEVKTVKNYCSNE